MPTDSSIPNALPVDLPGLQLAPIIAPGVALNYPDLHALPWMWGRFQAWPTDIEPEAEEERAFMGFDVRAHPQRDVGSTNFALDVWTFELRLQEEICWINHGPLRPLVEQPEGRAAGFRLCPECGELRPENPPPRKVQIGRDDATGMPGLTEIHMIIDAVAPRLRWPWAIKTEPIRYA